MYKAFLIDLDGTAYLGDNVIKETVEFVKLCRIYNKRVLFLTNNASRTVKEIYKKLDNMGYEIDIDEIYSSALAMASYLHEQGITDNIYVIGDEGLRSALESSNIKYLEHLDYENKEHSEKIKKIDNVVVGYSNKSTYKDLAFSSLVLQKKGAKLFSTNKDLILPNDLGGLPGNGSIVDLLEKVNNIKSIDTGKPSAIIMEEALKKLKLSKDEVCMIGDNYKTDILAGIENGIDTIFVGTGLNTKEEILNFDKQPTYILNNLSEYDFEK